DPCAVARALLQVAAARGFACLTLIVDDLEDLDHASVAMLRAILDESTSPQNRVLLIAAAARQSAASAALGLPARELPLEPFSINGTALWLRGVLAWEPSAEVVEWLYRRSGGLPRALRHAVTM